MSFAVRVRGPMTWPRLFLTMLSAALTSQVMMLAVEHRLGW